jgi:flagellar assembly protein FliH
MSSRIIRGDATTVVAPIAWRGAGARSSAAKDSAPAGDTGREDAADAAGGQDLPQQIRKAYQTGFQEGQAILQREHEALVKPLLERLTETLASFAELRTRMRRESEEEVVELSIAIARRVLHRELTLDPEAVRGLVKAAFERIGSREISRVRVHPAQSALLQTLIEKACPDRRVELVSDPALGPGNVIFETERGDLDASVDSQLEEIRRGLADRLEV